MTKTIKLAALVVLLCCPSLCGREVSMSVDEIFRIADTNNTDIGAAESGVAAARQCEAVARDARLPQINASLTLSYLGDGTILDRNFSNPTRDPLPHFSNTLGVELYQPVYTGGAISAGIGVADKGSELALNTKNGTVNSVRMALATNYLELAKHRNLLRVYDENIRLTEKLIEEMNHKRSQGLVLKNDITRYELRLSSLKYDRLATENAVRIFNNNLISMLRLEDGTEIIPDIQSDGELVMNDISSYWIESADHSSPSLKRFDILEDMEFLNRRIAHSEYLPKIGIIAGDNFLGPVTFEVPVINKNYNAWFVGLNVKWNISSLYTASKSTRRHDLEIFRIKTEREAAETALERNIVETLTLYRQSVERLEIERKNLQLAEENYRVVSQRFDNQLALFTDMLDASNVRLDAGVRLINAEISTRYYYYQLHYLAGTLTTL